MGWSHAVGMRSLPILVCRLGLSGDEYREDRRVVTGGVKVLQIQCVVPCLVIVGRPELTFAALELNRKDGWTGNENGVDSAAEPWHVELKVDGARQSDQCCSQDLDLVLPCPTLVNLKIKRVGGGQGAQNVLRISRQEHVNRRRVVRRSAMRLAGHWRPGYRSQRHVAASWCRRSAVTYSPGDIRNRVSIRQSITMHTSTTRTSSRSTSRAERRPQRRVVHLACLLVAILLTLAGCTSTPTDEPAQSSSGGIDSSGFVQIGGIDQWISMKGADRANPVILVVHGGPGEAQWPVASKYAPWERQFTVVQWDQRGAGRTFGRNGASTPEVNLERITRDGIEVVEHLCRTLGKQTVIVLGHSWGSIVAVRMVQRRPELFAAYVGTGQVASWRASVQMQFDHLLERARRDNDRDTVRELEAIGQPDPSNATQYFAFTRGRLGAAMPAADQEWLKGLRALTPASLGVDASEFKDLVEGMELSARSVLPDQRRWSTLARCRRHTRSWCSSTARVTLRS